MEEFKYDSGDEDSVWVVPVVTAAGLTSSNSETIRMINARALRIDGEKVTDRDKRIASESTYVIQIGKRKFRRVSVVRGHTQRQDS
jgi:tyrosyl-tRNA synthetase